MKNKKNISSEISTKNILFTIGAGFTAIILWLFIAKNILKHTIEVIPFLGISYTDIGRFFFVCILAPLWEEAAFRHAPLQMAKELKIKLNIDVIIPFAIISSCIFGWGHGSSPTGIMIQGVAGLILSYVYVKSGYKYWSTVVLHFLWNFSLYYIFPDIVSW